MKTLAIRLLSFGIPLGLALLAFVMFTSSREPPQQAALAETARTVRIQTVEPRSFVPMVTGYGNVEPVRTWNAVAQVPGRIEFVHPNLRVGAVFPAGAEIIRVAKEDYELAVGEAEANRDAATAELKELEIRAANTARSLEIERRSLEIKQEDLTRQEDLLRRGVASQSTLDTVQRDFLQQQVKVQELENSMNLYPAEIETQKTQIAVAEARLATAKLDLDRTNITMPFRGRIASKEVEATQFVSAGTTLASAGDIGAAEIVAQVPQDQFASFVGLAVPPDFQMPVQRDRPASARLANLGWQAKVKIHSSQFDAEWPAQIQHTSDTIDATSRSVGVIVRVDDPYGNILPGVRPPLVKGMFVRVILQAKQLEDQRIVPRSAVRDGRVFLANADNRLESRAVQVRAFQGSEALISEGLDFGDRVVVSDISPAIEGMLLAPMGEAPLTDQAAAAVSGE
ncbi:MAG: efflux RND transporter periplasmic adaptor subunit [Pseudomonadota bacterium]